MKEQQRPPVDAFAYIEEYKHDDISHKSSITPHPIKALPQDKSIPVISGAMICTVKEAQLLPNGPTTSFSIWSSDPNGCTVYWGCVDKKNNIRFWLSQSVMDEYIELNISKILKIRRNRIIPNRGASDELYEWTIWFRYGGKNKAWAGRIGYISINICDDTANAFCKYFRRRKVIKDYYLSILL